MYDEDAHISEMTRELKNKQNEKVHEADDKIEKKSHLKKEKKTATKKHESHKHSSHGHGHHA